jgi:two-component system, sensor histidine kinase LadS
LNTFRFLVSFLVGLTVVSIRTNAADTLVLRNPNVTYFQYQIHDNFLQVYHDTTGLLKIGEIKSSKFISPKGDGKKHTGTFWIKVTIKNDSKTDIRWMILQGDPHVGILEFYVPDDEGKYLLFNKGGSGLPFNLRKYLSNSIASELPVNAGETKIFYFRYQSQIEFSYKLTVQTFNFYTYYSIREYFFLGLYYGTIIIMAIYNLFIYFSVRDRIYIFYFLYVIAIAIFNTANDTLGFQFLWPEIPQLNYYTYYFSHLLVAIFIFLYSNSFLELKRQLPSYYKIIIISILIYIVQFFFEYNFTGTSLFYYTFLLPFILIYIAAIKILKQGYIPAKFFLAGFSAVLFGLLLFIFMERGIVASQFYTVYSFNAGLLIEVVVLSRAIGERFRFLKKEKEESDKKIIEQLTENEKMKDEINRELENKVAERTLELANAKNDLEKAYEEIKGMNELLKEDNDKLQYDIKELAKARVMLKGVNFEEFFRIYPTDDACRKFISDIKWRMGFKCSKCRNTKYSQGKTPYSKRCTTCNHDESPVMHTIFSRVKFPLTKAFYMLFLYVSSKEKLTSTHMSRILKLRQKTCWSFLQKIKETSEAKKAANKAVEKWTDMIIE